MGTTLTFPLSTTTTQTSAVVVDAPSAAVRENVANAFLGNGLLGPLRRDGKSDFANASGPALVMSSIKQILGLRGSTPVSQGELPWRPSLGSQLHRLRHSNNDDILEDFARVFVVEAIERFEPRAKLVDVIIQRVDTAFGAATALSITVKYRLINVNVPGNQVLIGVQSVTVEVPLAA